MKSKSFDLKRSTSEKLKQNKTFDFTSYYKSAAETKTAVENTQGNTENTNKENKFFKSKNGSPSKSERTPKKKNKLEPLDISHIDIDGPALDASVTNVSKSTPLNESKVTSTPHTSSKNEPKVKSIMKNKSLSNSDEHLDSFTYTSNKPKKRNKSVSFMLDDTEEVVVKKTKSNESIEKKADSSKKQSPKVILQAKKLKKAKKDILGKENKRNDNVNSEKSSAGKTKKSEKLSVKDDKAETVTEVPKDSPDSKEDKPLNKKGKVKKLKKQTSEESMEVTESNNNEDQAENKNRKAKKKKHSAKTQQNSESAEAEGEPAAKAQKKEAKPEAIAEDLESLSIGDNAHTLTNLLDEMTVVDKDKKKKNKHKIKKEKKTVSSTSSSESADLEKIEEGKEKIKWKKRKWNKDKKGEVDDDGTSTSVIVDNLPLSMVCNYKKQLADHFGKHGVIKKIGVAEVYPEQDSKPIFATTIQFESEAAAEEALREDQSEVCGRAVRVRRALPAPQTTLVLRSYAALTDQSVSSVLAAAGRIRSIRHLVKGKKAIATAFVEFDGPDALQRGLALAAGARVGGKRLHAARYELRARRPRAPPPEPAKDSEDSDH